MDRPRLLLADDHRETRELLHGLLNVEFDVVADVEDGVALVRTAEALSPDVIVTDISMPGMDGIAATTAILRDNRAARIVLISVNADQCLIECGLAAGALGYVLKHSAGEDLVPAVRAALLGQRHVSEMLEYKS